MREHRPIPPVILSEAKDLARTGSSGRFFAALRIALPLILFLFAASARAADSEGCLNCHQYRGLARITDDGQKIAHFYVDPSYYNHGLGPHARLKCTDCHRRNEVEVFPHEKTSPVNCTQECHLSSSNKLELRFSHQRVKDMIAGSVHKRDVLVKANEILGRPLRDNQATCLLCHDEPTFTTTAKSWVQQDAPLQRCNTCHTEELPRNTQFAFWHVNARSKPARNHQDIVKVCGFCHSNPKIQQEFHLPDTVASYVASFHGKATLLGSQETAGCLDCHVGALQNVHQMRAKTDVLASTNPKQLGDTCRSPACHPAAGANISTAAIHLNLPTSRGVEYFVGVIFVLLIIFTFGPSLMMCALKLLQIVIGRKDKDHEHHLHKVQRMMDDPSGRKLLKRFSPHQRLQHWYLMICFATLALTGFPIKFADTPWAAWMIHRIGGLTIARTIHHWAGAALIAGFVYHMLYIIVSMFKIRRQTGQNIFKVAWNLPMMVRPADGKFMLDLMLFLLLLKRKRPDGDRFNPEEKFEYIGVFWGTFVLGVTGLMLWGNAWASRYLDGRILTVAALLHTFEAFLALLHVGIVHMASVIFSPGVFPISRAMFTGDTPAEELIEAHSGMLANVEGKLEQPAEVSHG